MNDRAYHVLQVDDNPGDIHLTELAFQEVGIPVRFHAVADGAEALSFLRRQGGWAEAPQPDLILLDLNMPVMNGREVLAAIKGDERLQRIPTVVFTSSERSQDRQACLGLKADEYVVKPARYTDFLAVIESFRTYLPA